LRIRVGAKTDAGLVRANNEDSYLLHGRLFAVADGMGGHNAGEVASFVALRGLRQGSKEANFADEKALEEYFALLFAQINRDVYAQALLVPNYYGMGTTLTALGLCDAGYAFGHVGDSRLYLFRKGQLTQLTQDHSLVAELVQSGRLSETEALNHPLSNVLSRAIGVEPTVMVETGSGDVYAGDLFLLCTDGVFTVVEEDWIAGLLSQDRSPQGKAEQLVKRALEQGSTDNVTAVVVQVDGSV